MISPLTSALILTCVFGWILPKAGFFYAARIFAVTAVLALVLLALETAGVDITVNTICPAYIRTPLVEAQIQAQARTSLRHRSRRRWNAASARNAPTRPAASSADAFRRLASASSAWSRATG